MTDCFVGLGSNQGDRAEHLRGALRKLADLPGIRVGPVSAFRVTEPVGGPPQRRFLNAVVRLESLLEPLRTLHRLQAVERRHGRRRLVGDGPRTLDLDLLLFGQAVLDAPGLVLPHPRLASRRFVLEPLAELAPRLTLPDGRTPDQCLLELEP